MNINIVERYPELEEERYVVDKYSKSGPEGLKPMLDRLVGDGQAHDVYLLGGMKIEGTVDRVRGEYVVMNGDWDDIVIIPLHSIAFVRAYNEKFEEKIQELRTELQNQQMMAQQQQNSGIVVPDVDASAIIADLESQQDG